MKLLRFLHRRRLDPAAADDREVMLQENRPLRLAGARGRWIVCISGCAWITVPGVRDDIFLHEGDVWEVASDGKVLIEAVGRATVTLAAAAPA